MGLRSDIIAIIKDEAPNCIAEHDRDGHDKLHQADLEQIARKIVAYIKKREKK